MIPPNAGPLPGSLDWTAARVAELDRRPRFRVRFGPAAATLECVDHDEAWLIDRAGNGIRMGRSWVDAFPDLASTFGFTALRHNIACHPPADAEPHDVLMPPSWWGRRFA